MPIEEITITLEEQGLLDEAIKHAEFRPNPDPQFKSEIAEISPEVLPEAILKILRSTHGKVTKVGITRATRIPPHMHRNDSEIYFYGDGNATVAQIGEDGILRGTNPFTQNTMVLTNKGTGHAVETEGGKSTTFAFVKFVE